MATQFTDFSRAPLLESPWKNIFEDVLQGYKISQEPTKMKQESSARELANQLKKLDVEHKPKEYALSDQGKSLANALHSKALEHYEEKYALDKEYKRAQIDKINRGSTNVIKPNGKVANIAWVKQQLEDPNIDPVYAAQLQEALSDAEKHEKTIIDRSLDVVAGNSFDKLPTNDKKQSVALMKGMGVDPVEAVAYLRQKGNSPSTYAEQNKIDITNVEPDYAAGEQNIKLAQQANAYMDEIDTLDKHINDGLGKYQNKIMGYSLAQIADAAEGSNPDQQARALAARALLPELNSLRLKIAGGNIGIEALRELEHKSLGKLNVLESLVDSETYTKAQNYMTKWIKEAGQVRVKSLVNNSMLKKRLNQGAAKDSGASFNFGSYPVAGGR